MTSEQQEELVNITKSLVGKPYKYGAKIDETPDFFDCSLFIQYVFKKLGVKLPRSTIEQAEFAGEKVESLDKIETGDIIFLHGRRGHYNETFPEGIGHAVIYIGDSKVIHARSKRVEHNPKIVEKGEVRIDLLDEVVERNGPVVVIKRIENSTKA